MSTVVQQQVQDAKSAEQCFAPARGLPVIIDFSDPLNPYELAQEVVYSNGIVTVTLEKGFKWDGASIPTWLPIVPWLLSVALVPFVPIAWLTLPIALLVLYTLRLLPYMQHMGLHARAMCVHDKLYRAQKISRVVADAIMETILEYDGVPVDVRWLIYRRVRQFGWLAWRHNKQHPIVRVVAAPSVEVIKQ